jgi:hypothetical protein
MHRDHRRQPHESGPRHPDEEKRAGLTLLAAAKRFGVTGTAERLHRFEDALHWRLS